LKFLIIAALVAILLLLVYSKLYPYIKLVKKVLGTAKSMADSSASPGGAFTGSAAKTDRKLIRCVACGTWIPVDRAIGVKAGSSVYCSRECIENAASAKRKAVS
jgi:hypothetical protein